MSEPLSALAGASSQGFVRVREMGRQGMVSLRGDLDTPVLQEAVGAAAGHAMPPKRGIFGGLGAGVAWMSPDELLIFCAAEEAVAVTAQIGQALKDQHHLAVDVSDARAVFAIEGQGAREVIAKLCPVDMSPGQFQPGEIRRSRAAQIPAAFWMPDGESIHLVCFRSVARYAFDLLSDAAKTPLGFTL